ncbi:hypothetical protein VPH35_004557 [Triticum aestivum]
MPSVVPSMTSLLACPSTKPRPSGPRFPSRRWPLHRPSDRRISSASFLRMWDRITTDHMAGSSGRAPDAPNLPYQARLWRERDDRLGHLPWSSAAPNKRKTA